MSISIWLLYGVVALCALAVLFGASLAFGGRWRAAERLGHGVTLVVGCLCILGLTTLVGMGAYSRMRAMTNSFEENLADLRPSEEARLLGEFIAGVMNVTFASGAVVLFSMTLWMLARQRVKKLSASA